MELNYLDLLDLSDALGYAITVIRQLADNPIDEEDRKNLEGMEGRYLALKRKVEQFRVNNY